MNIDDLLFRNRNKDYGAYDLRKRYKKILAKSLLISTSLVAMVVLIIFLMDIKKQMVDELTLNTHIIAMEMMPIEETKDLKPKDLKPQPKKETETEVVREEEKKSQPKDSVQSTPEKKDSLMKLTDEQKSNSIDDQTGFIFTCGGDLSAFRRWFVSNYIYPKGVRPGARINKLLIAFRIDKHGFVDSTWIVNSIGKQFDNEALRVMKTSPRWEPCIYDGHPIRQQYSFLIYIP
jgi:periplasmic protein TonB